MGLLSAVIGLEVHAQLATRSKLFCACPVAFGGEPNSRVCAVCLGLPGSLPVPNREAVRLAVRFALAIGATVHPISVWARKNYFYPDLPKGYQISQFDHPVATGGSIRIEPPGQVPRQIGVLRVHLEEDAGKSIHEGFPDGQTGVDLNRCGVPLIEIVGEAEIHDPDEAYLYLERLKSTVRSTGVGNADMEKGELRCDANVSVHRPGEPWGTRVEIKNLNSFRHVRRALAHEIARQTAELDAGRTVEQETRLWSEELGTTISMRSKEGAHDYRYFPDPDLPALVVGDTLLADAAAGMPELPAEQRDRFVNELGLNETDAHRLTVEPDLAAYFEAVAAASGAARPAANWVLSEFLGRLREEGRTLAGAPLPPARLGALIRLVLDGTISGRTAKDVFDETWRTGEEPATIIDRRGLRQVRDDATVAAACRETVAAFPAQAEEYRRGKQAVLGFFTGQVMRRMRGAADAEQVKDILRTLLG